MEKSQSIKNIAAALVKFAANMGKIHKSELNPFFKSKYAALPDILSAIEKPLQDAGLFISQHPTANGLITILMHSESGEYLQSTYPLNPAKPNDPQALGSAITYARRYAIGAILNLNIDEDDDGNAAAAAANKPASLAAADKPKLQKISANGEITEQWKRVEAWVRQGGNPDAVLQKYAVDKSLLQELRNIAITV